MRRGTAALENGDAQAALSEYEMAKRLVPSANAPWYFSAEALMVLGRWREAVEGFEVYLAKDPTVSDADRVRDRIAKIRAEHFPARVHVSASAEGAVISIDGERRGPPGTFELRPGTHHIEAAAPSYTPSAKDLDLTGDTDTDIPLSLRPIDRVPPPQAPTPILTEPTLWPTVGWLAAGAGAVALGTTVVIDTAVLGPKFHDFSHAADQARVGNPTDVSTARDLSEQVQSIQHAVLVGYVVSGALVIAGLSVALFAPKTTRKVGVNIAPGRGSSGLTSFTF
jgi:hypothetical protein